jgi:hypothetical protein
VIIPSSLRFRDPDEVGPQFRNLNYLRIFVFSLARGAIKTMSKRKPLRYAHHVPVTELLRQQNEEAEEQALIAQKKRKSHEEEIAESKRRKQDMADERIRRSLEESLSQQIATTVGQTSPLEYSDNDSEAELLADLCFFVSKKSNKKP